MERLGLEYEQIRSEYPKLIFAHLNSWGRAGEKMNDPGYDYGPFWAGSGISNFIRSSDNSPPPRFPGAIGDNSTAMNLVAGIAMALYHRERTGEGQLVDAALYRTGIWCMSHLIVQNRGGFQSTSQRGSQVHSVGTVRFTFFGDT